MIKSIRYYLLGGTLLLTSLLTFYGLKADSPEEFQNGTIDIGVVVSDLDRSIAFYTDVLGMTKTGGFSLNRDFGMNSGLTGGTPVDIHVLKLKDGDTTTQFKIMSFDNKAQHPHPAHIQDDTGIQYITIAVTSIEPFLKRIRAHDVKLLGDTPIPLGDGRDFVLIQDPDGTFIELIGP